jgi:hypothetical protein
MADDPPFDLSKFDPSTLDLSHLRSEERNRIQAGGYDNRELSLLLRKQNPWTKTGKPEPLPSPPSQPKEDAEAPIDFTSTRKPKPPTEDGKTPIERYLEKQKNAPPESDEDRRLRRDEELQSRKESLHMRQEFELRHRDYSEHYRVTPTSEARAEQPSPKQEPTLGEKWLLIVSGFGDVILALIGGTQAKLWVSLVMLVAACAIQILVIVKVQPFRARKWNVLLGVFVVVVLTLLWWGARPDAPPASVAQTSTTISQSEDDLRTALRADGNQAIRTITTRIKLKRKYSIDEIGHFRIMYELATTTNKIVPEFYLACQDYYAKNEYAADPSATTFGSRTVIRYRQPNDTYKPTPSFEISPRHYGGFTGLDRYVDSFDVTWDLHNQVPSYKTLEDINGKELYIFVTESLANKISEVSFQVNNWELFSVKADRLVFPDDKPIAPWFLPLSKQEQAVAWKSVNVRFDEPLPPAIAARFKGQNPGWTWSLDFGLLHPKKIPEPELKVDTFKPS